MPGGNNETKAEAIAKKQALPINFMDCCVLRAVYVLWLNYAAKASADYNNNNYFDRFSQLLHATATEDFTCWLAGCLFGNLYVMGHGQYYAFC